MKPSKDILAELQHIAPALAKLDKKNFYTVSEGYFGDSSARIIELVEDVKNHSIQLPPVLASINIVEHYTVPEGYFASFSDSLRDRIHAEEVAEELIHAAPALVGVEKRQTYTVPANYFSMFPMVVSKLSAEESKTHDSAIEHGISRWSLWIEKVARIAWAPRYSFTMACMIAIAVVVSIVFTHSTLTPEEKIFAQMQQIPESDLQKYMGKHRDEFDEHTILHNIKDIEFIHNFDKPDNIPAHLRNGNKDVLDNISEDIID